MTQEKHEKILDRIRKLLSLANSSNEHEAANAAAMAAELMMKHQISEAALADDDSGDAEIVEQEVLDETGRLVQWRIQLATGLAEAFDCACYVGRIYTTTGKQKQKYMVVGQPSKQSTIRYMYAYLVSEIERLADVAYGEEVAECHASRVAVPSSRGWKNGFRLGAAVVIRKRLREQRAKTREEAQAIGQGQALMRIDAQALAVDDFLRRNVEGLKQGARAQVSSRSGYQAGRAAGSGVSLGGGGRGALGAGAKRLKS